ncbi:MAG: MarR family transcriptional regulator [Candidatus Omnitrophota bacterium]|nr:MarR family transcriptional regulator [Candidatus Omnitrophota bacterium]
MSDLSLSEFADRVRDIMAVVSREFIKYQTKDFYRMKITMPQFIVLNFLSTHGESSMTDLAHYIKVTTAAVTGMVDRLVREGYATRLDDPKDRRIKRLTLTSKGNKIVGYILGQHRKVMMEMFGMISAEERAEYLKILEHIQHHIKEREALSKS